MSQLVIVESPKKAKEFAHILGSNYIVKASVGHIRDLPLKELGIDTQSLIPKYEPTDRGKKVIAELKQMAKHADFVYLATDPDREGEAISWHLAEALRLRPNSFKRVTTNEITERGVRRALEQPREIDMCLVRAQEARRVLDRLVGYIVSPALWDSGVRGLSAGRVQSVALRLIVERSRVIANHVKVFHFGAKLDLDADMPEAITWNTKPYANEDGLVMDRGIAEEAASAREVRVLDQSTSPSQRKAPAPFTTSSLQQAANARLGLSSKESMALAQSLFDSGKITYHRTDSVRISEEGLENIRNFARSQGLPIPNTPVFHKGKAANAQEAHECIRPTDMFVEPRSMSGPEQALYELIHRQTLACQMPEAKLSVTKAVFEFVHPQTQNVFTYDITTQLIDELGFMAVQGKVKESTMPDFRVGDVIPVMNGRVTDEETKPPSFFTEATLVKKLEQLGIGRPSTYAAIIENIKNRRYVDVQGKSLVATSLGDSLVTALRPNEESGCTFMEYDYTALLEESLDAIARGETDYVSVVSQAFGIINQDAQLTRQNIQSSGLANASTDAVYKKGSRRSSSGSGKKTTRKKASTGTRSRTGTAKRSGSGTQGTRNNNRNSGARSTASSGSKSCPKCSTNMALRNGRYGEFWSCPSCRTTISKK